MDRRLVRAIAESGWWTQVINPQVSAWQGSDLKWLVHRLGLGKVWLTVIIPQISVRQLLNGGLHIELGALQWSNLRTHKKIEETTFTWQFVLLLQTAITVTSNHSPGNRVTLLTIWSRAWGASGSTRRPPKNDSRGVFVKPTIRSRSTTKPEKSSELTLSSVRYSRRSLAQWLRHRWKHGCHRTIAGVLEDCLHEEVLAANDAAKKWITIPWEVVR